MPKFRLCVVGCVMSKVLTSPQGGFALRFILAGFGLSLLAGCADSGRFGGDGGDAFSNPFKTSSYVDRNATGTANSSSYPNSGQIQSHALASPGPVASYSAPAHPSPQLAAAQSPSHSDMTGSVGHTGMAGWSAMGGTPVVVANGETADTIANRYGIPREALIHTNGFASASEIRPGTRLVIPVYNASLAASSGAAPMSSSEHAEKLKFVKGPEPVSKADKRLAAKEMAKHSKDKIAEKQTGAKPADKKMAMKEQSSKKPAEAPKSAPAKSAKAETSAAETHKAIDSMPTASLPSDKTVESASASESANPEFRWPAHGRIIQGFKAGGNDGINIAVPEGTSVKAVEAGVVAYAGNELKGYGNLVLIRHPNGFVSAYANNSDIEVKRGDTVKRGQTIAKSGQSGNVASPQLHFELRKGSTPVDPSQYLAGL
jgi:murein DD-endopeptidase MepM/ murein hydrolase activator NlpD